MPQALEVDREHVKLIAFQVGVREAARQLGLNEDTVMQWSKREKWSEQFAQAQQAKEVKIGKQPLEAHVSRNPLEVLARLGDKSKLRAAKVGDNTLRAISRRKEDKLIASAPAYLATVNALAKVHGWGSDGKNNSGINLAIQVNAANVPSE